MANAYVLPVLSYMYVVPLQLRDIMLARPGTCTRPSHFARLFLSLMLPPWWSCPSELYAVRLTLSGSIHKPTASTRHEVSAASMTNACQGREGRESRAGGCQHGTVLRTNSLGTDIVIAPCGVVDMASCCMAAALARTRRHRASWCDEDDGGAACRHALRGCRRRAPWASWGGRRASRR
jgi:hypothetical protein